jgi:hypothetical protein
MLRRTCHKYSAGSNELAAAALCLTAVIAAGCAGDSTARPGRDSRDAVTLTFQLDLNRVVYEDSLWGDPPQLAIWIENERDQSIRMVRVTHRTAACDWVGKVDCPVALPYWVAFYNRQTGTQGPPTWNSPAVDAITCATPRAELIADVEVPRGSRWTYFIEVNVSGDFNADFPRLSEAGVSDPYGNGQPSLVYRGRIEAVEGAASRPQIAGRTDQYEPTDRLNENTEGITTARNLLRGIAVSCRSRLVKGS